MSTTTVTAADLRPIDLFDDLDDAELERWAAVTHVHEYKPGDIVAEQGQRQPSMFLVLEGTLQGLLVNDGRVEPAGQHRAPTWMGRARRRLHCSRRRLFVALATWLTVC